MSFESKTEAVHFAPLDITSEIEEMHSRIEESIPLQQSHVPAVASELAADVLLRLLEARNDELNPEDLAITIVRTLKVLLSLYGVDLEDMGEATSLDGRVPKEVIEAIAYINTGAGMLMGMKEDADND